MPSGNVHYEYYKRGYLFILPISLLVCVYNFIIGIGLLIGYTFHRWFDNDLDIMGTSACEGRQVNELPIIGHILFGISSTYGSVFRRHHRKFITHFPFVSTFIRLLFLGFPLYFVLKSFDFNFQSIIFLQFIMAFWVGLSLADFLHWLLDKIIGD